MADFDSLVGKGIRLNAKNTDVARKRLYADISPDEVLIVTADNQGQTTDGSGSRQISAVTADGRTVKGSVTRFLLVTEQGDQKIPNPNPEYVGKRDSQLGPVPQAYPITTRSGLRFYGYR